MNIRAHGFSGLALLGAICGMLGAPWGAQPWERDLAPRKPKYRGPSRPRRGARGFNTPGRSVKSLNHKRNGGRSHNTRRSR